MANINTKFRPKKMDSGFCCNSANIVLIGFMGSGKSSVGALLSRRTRRFLLDCDSLIEQREEMPIAQIFRTQGEPHFRACENEIATWLNANVKNAVISTGGGLPQFVAANILRNLGIIIYLELTFDAILQRMDSKEIAKRPLFSNKDSALELFLKRTPIYASLAHHKINADKEIEVIVDDIINILANKGNI